MAIPMGVVVDPSDVINQAEDELQDAAITTIHGAGHNAWRFSGTGLHKKTGGHTGTGIMADGNSHQMDYFNDKTGKLITDKQFNGEYIKGMQERYGTEDAKDNYFKNATDRVNNSKTTKP